MRRIAVTVVLLAALTIAVLSTTGASNGDGDTYLVRALFDNAANIVEGEDVKIAGARVGRVKSLDVTPIERDGLPDNKAVLVLEIEKPGFAPFKNDAECSVRPQSLIGEKFVECDPGAADEELPEVPDGEPGAGQHLLGIDNNSTPVDLDLINNTLRLPYRERLAILINEFGTGLAGRGEDLNEAIHRANPALRETDRVLAILAEENRVLANLARDSDRVLGPLARDRDRVTGFIEQANDTAQATAERREDIERSFERLPRFLPELRATFTDLGAFADEMTPVLRDLGTAAPDFNRFVRALGPFSAAGLPAIQTLGDATDDGRPALRALRPLIGDLRQFTRHGKPVARNLSLLTRSLDQRGAIEYLMDYIFFQMTAINGFDGISHYLRANLITNLCSSYQTQPLGGCSANFSETEAVPAGAGERDKTLDATQAVLRGERPPQGETAEPIGANPLAGLLSLNDPQITQQRENNRRRIREGAEGPGTPVPGLPPGQQAMLDYLLGGEAP